MTGAAILVSSAGAVLPPATRALMYRSGDQVPDIGVINSPFSPGIYGGPGFFGQAINNSGTATVLTSIFGPPVAGPLGQFRNTNHAVLSSDLALVPYLAGYDPTQVFGTPSCQVTVPSTDYMFDQVYWTAANNSGNRATILGLIPVPGATVTPITGVYFNRSAMPLKNGDPVTAAGVAPGTVFAAFGPARVDRYNGAPLTSTVGINDSNVLLLGCSIIESGQPKNAILKVALDSNGAVLSQTLVAKVGGSVGGSGDTWTSLTVLPNTCAMNNAGQVIFSGTTSGGSSGIYRTNAAGTGGAFVALSGGASPGGSTWGPLVGMPVHINASGSFAFRGVPQGNGLWTEIADAGDTFTTANSSGNDTAGGGPLVLMSGQLTDDQDVDLYQIMVGDATLQSQVPFSATTVPNAGAGFAGAAFDTVLYLFATNQNCNGNTRIGVGRNDDAAAGVVQSTLTTASLRADHVPGTRYYLGVSTGKSRAQARSIDMWQRLPSKLASAGGIVYWVEPGTGQIDRADASTGAMLSPLQVGVAPTQTSGNQSTPNDGPVLDSQIALYDAGVNSRLIFRQKGFGVDRFKSCNLSGGDVQELALGVGFSSGGASAIAVDSVNGKLYWTRPSSLQTAIYRSNIDGSLAEVAQAPVDSCDCDIYTITAMAVDNFGTGRLYWYESLSNRIVYQSLTNMPANNASGVTQVLTGANVTAMTIDSAARRLYFTTTSGNAVRVIDLTSNTLLPNIAATTTPEGIALDGGRVYWSNPAERMLRRSLVAAPSVENWLSLGGDLGERPSDGPNHLDCAAPTFVRTGTASGPGLPYQIQLTGATFSRQGAQISKDNASKIVQVGDTLPAGVVSVVGSANGTIRITDRGLVAWTGTVGGRVGLQLNSDVVLDTQSTPSNSTTPFGTIGTGFASYDVSSSGQHIAASMFNGSFTGPSGDSMVRVEFASVPGCAADFDGSGALSVQDIFDFLNAWFSGGAGADFNGTGGVSVQDIFDFLNAWFAGC